MASQVTSWPSDLNHLMVSSAFEFHKTGVSILCTSLIQKIIEKPLLRNIGHRIGLKHRAPVETNCSYS